ncbi:MAG: hypothetical protein IJ064_00145 [Bacteroidaceae bacterium]|nr:hypothetical protein [Bacteroidaceae bacterium]
MRIIFSLMLLLPVVPICAQQELWEIEAESADTHVIFCDDTIEIRTSAGLTLWRRRPMSVPFCLEYEAMVVQCDSADRLSDLNCFWLATDPAVPDGSVLTRLHERNGGFGNAASLRLYYLGYGGNWNTTTRFRRYNGQPQPPLLYEYTDSAHLLRPNHWYSIRIEASQAHTRYYADGELLVDYADPQPLVCGWFGFRTTWSHCRLRGFRIEEGGE